MGRHSSGAAEAPEPRHDPYQEPHQGPHPAPGAQTPPGQDPTEWEDPPPPAPLWRRRIVPSAALLVAVLAGTWWAVSWLTGPAGPNGPPALDSVSLRGSEQTPAPPPSLASAADSAGSPAPGQGADVNDDGSGSAEAATAAPPTPGAEVTVHVAGQVHDPGIVRLPPGARIAEALEAAGGPTPAADLDRLNLAAPVQDGTQILVPGPDTPVADTPLTAPAAPQDAGAPEAPPPTGSSGGAAAGTVNLNTADAATLEQLPGIGPALAARIIEHRDQVGPYTSLADLDAVSGIGPAILGRLDGAVSW